MKRKLGTSAVAALALLGAGAPAAAADPAVPPLLPAWNAYVACAMTRRCSKKSVG